MHATAMLPSDAESRSAMLLHQTTSECECDSNVVADDSEAHEWLNEVGRLPPRHFWIFNPYVTISQMGEYGVNYLNFGCYFGCRSGVTVLDLFLISRGYSLV